jgi:hypothetical protein
MAVILSAGNEERYLFEKLFQTLFNKKIIKVYTDKKDAQIIKNSSVLKIVKSCKNADLVLNVTDMNCSKPLFVLDYYVYKNHPEAIGAFYWRKGRPQLRLRKKLIKKYHLHVTKDFEDFLE